MEEKTSPKFIFESKALDKNTFHVVSFKGTEGLSTIYRFDITLISEKASLDVESILQNPVVFTIKRSDGDIPFHGMLSSFEQMQQVGGMVFYRVELIPRLWWTQLTSHNQIFLNKNAQQFITDSLTSGGMRQDLNFDFKLQGSYPTREYVCQYNESYFNFVSRWMERDGMYYYFEQTRQGEKMIVTDTHIAHSTMSEGTNLIYSPPSGLDTPYRDEVIKNFILRQQPLPKKVLLKDYFYEKPSLDMKAEAIVSSKGHGEVYLYGDHFQSLGEGQKLAKVRAEEYRCREKLYYAVSTVPYVRTGYIFELKDHYRNDFNQRYLTIQVTHEGSQERYLTSGLRLRLTKNEDRLFYRNSFSCIPAGTQFRPQRLTHKPKFHGSMNAKIDASGTGQYAELDGQGRYKVVLPLDISGKGGGKATTWLRMTQPYGGSGHGMHFPLHKGTEVLLTCIDGDPDRPIIQGAVPNPETPSMVSDANQTQCQITTGGQNKIHIEDMAGSERILMQSPTANTWMRMGAPNDPDDDMALGAGEDTNEQDDATVRHDAVNPDQTDASDTTHLNPGTSPADSSSDSSDSSSDSESTDPPPTGISQVASGGSDGFRLYTSKHFDTFAGSRASTTLGNTFSSTGGGSESILVGNNLGTNLAIRELFFAGLDTSFKMGGTVSIAPYTVKIYEMESKFKASKTEVDGNKNAIEGENTSLTGSTTDLNGERTDLNGSNTNLNGDETTLSGSSDELVGVSTELTGSNTAVQGDDSEVVGSANVVAGQVSDVVGSDNNIAGSTLQVAGDDTATVASQTTVAASKSKISSQEMSVSGLFTVL